MDGVFSPWHIIVVLVVAAVLFYRGDKLPDMARSVGRSLRVFKTEIKGLAEDDKAREAAGTDTANDSAGDTGAVHVTKAIEAPATHDTPPAARVAAVPSEPIAVKAEVIRPVDNQGQPGARPRPRPASTSRQ